MGIDGGAGRLNDEDVSAAHILQNLKIELSIRKARRVGSTQGQPQVLTYLLGESPVGVASEEL
jgi:hypothetical protein